MPVPAAITSPAAPVPSAASEPQQGQKAAGEQSRVPAAQAVVFCRVCGAKHGLWSFLGGAAPTSSRGTPSAAALASRRKTAAAAAAAPAFRAAGSGTAGDGGAAGRQSEGQGTPVVQRLQDGANSPPSHLQVISNLQYRIYFLADCTDNLRSDARMDSEGRAAKWEQLALHGGES